MFDLNISSFKGITGYFAEKKHGARQAGRRSREGACGWASASALEVGAGIPTRETAAEVM